MEATPDDHSVLQALTAAYPEALSLGGALTVAGSEDDATVWGKLRLALESHAVFGKGRPVFAGGHQLQLHPTSVAKHICRALNTRGPADTLRWLHELFGLEDVTSRACAEFIGVNVEQALSLSNGVRLVPFKEMRTSWHSEQLRYHYGAPRPFMTEVPSDVAGMYLVVASKFTSDPGNYGEDFSPFFDVALGLTAASSGAPVIGATWSEYENTDYTDAEIGWTYRRASYDGRPPSFQTVDVVEDHVDFIDRFLSLQGKAKGACSTAAARLNSARRRVDPAASIIDLATAFESILATRDETSEISYRLKLRAALALGTSYQERLEVSKCMNELYSIRSKAVHGVASALPDNTARPIVEWADGACARLLRTVVNAGRLPDLKKLELTGDASEAFQ